MPTASNQSSNLNSPAALPAVSLEHVTVRYRVPRERVSGLKEYSVRWLQRRLHFESFLAVNDVTLDVQKGEVFGIIGRNGSGKSTLMKVIARVLVPTQGRVVLRGRVAPLLELGAAFHPELSGRENVFLNSALLGRSREEVEALMPEVIDFAEIGDFIDAPLRTYSTGMIARLGFSVATCVRPEILLVDEVLSVGDVQFQQKCLDRMYSFQAQGTTILIVSHSMATIDSFCKRALWLDKGIPKALGPVSNVIGAYIEGAERQVREKKDASTSVANLPLQPAVDEDAPLEYTSLPDVERVYPAGDALSREQGTLAAWVKFSGDRPYHDTVIFHTDDSRYVFYVGSYYSDVLRRDIRVLVGRAGGNRRVMDAMYGTSSYPEASVHLDMDGAGEGIPWVEDEWHHVSMAWKGSPAGTLTLMIDGLVIAEGRYDSRYDNGQPPAAYLAAGMRPREWAGEIVENPDGTVTDSRPDSALSVSEGNLDIHDLRLYRLALKPFDIRRIMTERVIT